MTKYSPDIGSAQYPKTYGIGGLGDTRRVGCGVVSAEKSKQTRHPVEGWVRFVDV